MISIDITLLIQIVNFLVSLWIINYFIIRPIRGNLAKRRSMVDADFDETERLRQKADIATIEHEEAIIKIRANIALHKHSTKEEAENKAHSIVDESNDKSRIIRSEASARIREESSLALVELEAKISGFTRSALTKVLD